MESQVYDSYSETINGMDISGELFLFWIACNPTVFWVEVVASTEYIASPSVYSEHGTTMLPLEIDGENATFPANKGCVYGLYSNAYNPAHVATINGNTNGGTCVEIQVEDGDEVSATVTHHWDGTGGLGEAEIRTLDFVF